MSEKVTSTSLSESSVQAFTEALKGERGSLDAWLECNDEAEVRAHVEAYASRHAAPQPPAEAQPENTATEALEYVFGKMPTIGWRKIIDERLTPPWPLEHHARAMGLFKDNPPPSAPVGVEDESVRVGNLPTMNQDGYPGLGEWWVQLWRGDEIIARVYGDGPDEVRSQAQDIADALNQRPAAVDEAMELLDEAYGELAADSYRDGPRSLLLTRMEAALAAQQGGSDNDR